jgi:hypothetical protein
MTVTVEEAYKKVKTLKGCNFLVGCWDMGEMWGFVFSPTPYDPEDPETFFVGGVDTVNKKTGEISAMSSVQSLELPSESVPQELMFMVLEIIETSKDLEEAKRAIKKLSTTYFTDEDESEE